MGRLAKDNWKPTVNVVTWFLMTTAILCVLTRLGTKYWIFRRWTTDDYLSIVSMVLCAAQSLALSMATAHGYGEHYGGLSGAAVDHILKSQYAAAILFIMTMCLSKLALIHFIWSVTPATSDRRIAIGLEIFTVLWAVASVIASIFQCTPPRTWDYLSGQCFNMSAWWNYLGATNILSESGIIVQALLIIVGIQANWTKKGTLATIFGLRIFVIAAIIGQLIYINKTITSKDPTFDTWAATISTQLVQCLSVVTACSPQFKPFMDSLRSTGMRIDGLTSYHMASTKRHGLSSLRYHSTFHGSETHELTPVRPVKDTYETTITASGAISDGDAESQSSETHIIREVRTFAVTESVRDRRD
ncbi:hypothetical protein BDV32DRAFT_135249 [Aspergillus pseudonomiae]|uniref:Rhodopsin domain-containing protein n=1 Tax=Aspergillus pseudonomiae TaxID=1506151 RepID=A0A5N7DRP3_9EURO|nr:uncharacterized protein BDV37DRAFT_267902 [Aspergillus pseudonomiae]KAB8264300.1 hypothetical protein BDV32DRAFT_135249 [Aspergillus pseudonomiae]KAE8409147.1 hypothetical protein BDV37DRAFT_267902 [Aspergillus pseudonomiae]